jgi:hypothetical protein
VTSRILTYIIAMTVFAALAMPGRLAAQDQEEHNRRNLITPSRTWEHWAPMTDLEAANLQAYAQDVAAVQGAGGNRLRLDITFNWLGASDYTIGSRTTGLGYTPIPAAEFISEIDTTTDKALAAVADVIRPDGSRAVDTIYFDAEVTVGNPADNKANEEWFLTTNYPRFFSVVSAQGIRPAVYFIADGTQAAVLDDTWIDPNYSILKLKIQ